MSEKSERRSGAASSASRDVRNCAEPSERCTGATSSLSLADASANAMSALNASSAAKAAWVALRRRRSSSVARTSSCRASIVPLSASLGTYAASGAPKGACGAEPSRSRPDEAPMALLVNSPAVDE